MANAENRHGFFRAGYETSWSPETRKCWSHRGKWRRNEECGGHGTEDVGEYTGSSAAFEREGECCCFEVEWGGDYGGSEL